MPRWTPRHLVRRVRDHFRGSPATASGTFDTLARTWNALGEEDPLWAVLTRPGTRGGRWDVDEFFQSGRSQMDAAIGFVVDEIGWPLGRQTALDFGCGVGRVTQALCRHFATIDGVDIAPSMILAADRYNRFGDRCRYHVNARPDLSMFPDGRYDFVYSSYVLQHIHPTFARGYVEEFVRVMAPGGICLFNIPTKRLALNRPMPRSWFAADEELLESPPRTIPVGGHATVLVHVANRGPGLWPSRGGQAVRVGARWRRHGSIVGDEARVSLPCDLGPGEEATVHVHAPAPPSPGHYRLECGLLQEGVAWFVQRGGHATSAEIDVAAGDERPLAAAPQEISTAPPMEMHATPAEEVNAWIRTAGGRVVRTVDAPPDDEHEGTLFAIAHRDDAHS